MNNLNISKNSLAEQFYNLLDENVVEMSEVVDLETFQKYYKKVLEDYNLNFKSTEIE